MCDRLQSLEIFTANGFKTNGQWIDLRCIASMTI